jgi:hypothetical protein
MKILNSTQGQFKAKLSALAKIASYLVVATFRLLPSIIGISRWSRKKHILIPITVLNELNLNRKKHKL